MKFIRFLSISLFLAVGLFTQAYPIQAEACDEHKCNPDDTDFRACSERKQSCLESAIKETRSKSDTLKNTISILNGQIQIQQLQINQTLSEIKQLEKEISDLSVRIAGLEISLDRMSNLLVERVNANYKHGDTNPLLLLVSSDSVTELLSQMKYLRVAQKHVSEVMQRAEAQRLDYDQQKMLKEEKQKEVEQKQIQLQRQQNQLASQKQEQQQLLTFTQNDEKRYQNLLAEAKRELAQIQQAANTIIREGNGVQVKKGEVIGTMGNTGYSKGAHLHFGIYRYSQDSFQSSNWSWYYSDYVNPLEKLGSKSVLWATGCPNDPSGQQNSGSGNWDWPMSNIRITQNFGSDTCYNWMYGGKPHPALDIVGSGDISIRTVDDGEAYFCRNCLGDGGNGVFIFHKDNYMTLYWHLK